VLLVTAVAGWWGCDSRGKPTSQTSPGDLAVAAADWSREEAAGRLDAAQDGVRAAVRLVHLADCVPLCAPDELTAVQMRGLRLVRLREDLWALGLADRREPRNVRAPVLISATGEVTPLAEGVEEELLVLHVSRDADVFPHVAVFPQRVLLIGEQPVPALVLEAGQRVRFALRTERRFSYLALLAPTDAGETEVARYRWDPYEVTFTGPASDKLPDPPGGRFRIDLKASERLEPIGGELPEPEENKPRPRPPEELPLSPSELQAT
jgi:hypothetical protein